MENVSHLIRKQLLRKKKLWSIEMTFIKNISNISPKEIESYITNYVENLLNDIPFEDYEYQISRKEIKNIYIHFWGFSKEENSAKLLGNKVQLVEEFIHMLNPNV